MDQKHTAFFLFSLQICGLRFSDWNTKEIMNQLMEAGGDVGGCITVYWHRSYQCFGSGFIDSKSGFSILG
jgi:hypothetical protein